MVSKRKRLLMSSSPSAESPKVYLRLRKNGEGEWRAVPRSEVAVPQASNSPQGAEDMTGLNGARNDAYASSSDALQNRLQTPNLAPLTGTLANGTPNGDLARTSSATRRVKPKSILKRSESLSQSGSSPSSNKSPEKNVRIRSDPEIKFITPVEIFPRNRLVTPPPASRHELEIVALDTSPDHDNMSDTQRPKLKLSFSSKTIARPEPVSTPSSAVPRTPSLKLNLKPKGLPTPVIKPEPNGTPESSTKKRKRTQKAIEADASTPSDDEKTTFRKPAPPVRKLTIKHGLPKPAQRQTPTSGLVPAIKLKYKGKMPRRPIGVGYDSEHEEREQDPVILEGFILRMQPGPDAEYVRKAISEGTVGLPRASGGADIQIRFFDTHGRRGVVVVRQQRYAASLVDLPCIVEGMKSWDKKGWIKSIDVCQMLLVLGKCNTDDEARTYPLPVDVGPKTYQYAHGLTAPMRWVRKRRFNRTKRARVDDIEAVERRVKALLEGDEAADTSTYTLHDHDPREDNGPGEESGEYESESGMEGSEEPEAAGTPVDYFAAQNSHGATAESPQDDVDEDTLAQMFDDEDQDDSRLPAPQLDHVKASLHPPEDGSSFAVTSASGSPSAAAQTPASGEDDEDSGDEDDEEDDEEASADEAEEEGDENRQQALDRIDDMKKKISEQTEVMRATENAILKKKIAGKISGLKADVEQMRRAAGLESEEED